MFKNLKVKLIDFGCAIEFCDNDLFTSFSGTSEFYPYEWFNSGYYCPIGGAVWSIGCLMFTLLTGKSTNVIVNSRLLATESVNPVNDIHEFSSSY